MLDNTLGLFDRISSSAFRTPQIEFEKGIALRLFSRSLLKDRGGTFSARLAFPKTWAAFFHGRRVFVTVIHVKIGPAQRGHGQLIAPFVFPMTGVTFYPAEFDLVNGTGQIESLP